MAIFNINVPSTLKIDLTVHSDEATTKTLSLIISKLNSIMATQAELQQQLTDLGTQLDKVLGEIQAEIQKLQDAITNAGTTTPEVDAALASLKAKVQTLDDLNPDA